MLRVVPALAARILAWALYRTLKSASCSCHIPNSPLPAGRCGRARTNYGRQMKTRSRIAVASWKHGRVNAVRAAFNAGFISAADRGNHTHNQGRCPSERYTTYNSVETANCRRDVPRSQAKPASDALSVRNRTMSTESFGTRGVTSAGKLRPGASPPTSPSSRSCCGP
jgi:hypothetical protein